MSMSLCSAAEYLKGHDRFLILTHKNPDGDTIGSAAALCRALRCLGKEAYVYKNPGFTPRYSAFLEGMTAEEYMPDCIVAVDIADIKLLPSVCEKYADKISLAIDHHPTHRSFCENILLDADAAACGEIIFSLINSLGIEISLDIATALYVAVSTDTGCFLYSNTTPQTHKIAAALLECGVKTDLIHRDFFITKTRARLSIEAKLIDGMHFYCGGKAAVAKLSLALISSVHATEDDLDNIGSLTRSIEGAELGILIRELEDGSCKLSVRSGEGVNAAALCAHFGGGGHIRAAGCTINAPLDQAEAQVVAAVDSLKIFSD